MASPSPRVSILLPVRNEALRLARALRSLQRQTITDWECIIVDDGSDDDTADMATRFARDDPRFHLCKQAPSGLVAALNHGFAHCRAPFVARMDGDDVSHPARLAEQLALLDARPDIGAASCQVRLFPRRDLRVGLLRYERWLNGLVEPHEIAADMFVECPVAHPTVMMRRQVLEDCGGYQDHGWPEDYDLFLRLHTRGVRFAKVPRPLFCWCDRPERYQRTSPNCTFEAFIRCKLHYLRPRVDGAVAVRGAGPTGLQVLRQMRALAWDVHLLVDVHRGRIGQRIDGIPVVAPHDHRLRALPLLVVVGVEGARDQIRAELRTEGRVEGRDHWFLA